LLFKMVGKLRICKTVAKSVGFSNRIKAVGKKQSVKRAFLVVVEVKNKEPYIGN